MHHTIAFFCESEEIMIFTQVPLQSLQIFLLFSLNHAESSKGFFLKKTTECVIFKCISQERSSEKIKRHLFEVIAKTK